MNNLAASIYRLQTSLQELLAHTQSLRNDELVPCKDWKHWLDEQRRVIKNAYGPLSHPESEPDWSLHALNTDFPITLSKRNGR